MLPRRLLLALALVAAMACRPTAKTPEEAYRRYSLAVAGRDGGALFDALDQGTRWCWMTVQRTHREAYDILLSSFPEGPDRTRQLRRFEAGALASHEREVFAAWFDAARFGPLAQTGGATPAFEPAGDGEVTAVVNSVRLPFRRGPKDGGWGYAGLAAESDDAQRRAIADLEIIRRSAADWERAAARGGR